MLQSIKIILLLSFFVLSLKISAQANLTIQNNSKRLMTVKVMKGYGEGELYKTVSIDAFGSRTIYFTESGYYFTKSKAVLSGKDPIYRKGNPFDVRNDSYGYSELILTFSITESNVPRASGGRQISKSEFDKN